MITPRPLRPAIFLDRDGTLIEETGYLSDPGKVRLIPGAAEALIALQQAGYLRIVITNQSGIGRGIFTRDAFDATQAELIRLLAEAGAAIDATYVCPHAPEAGCLCRKPWTALHREAIATFGIDTARSWFVGDHVRDLQPAGELGGRTLLVETGHGASHAAEARTLGADVVADLGAGSAAIARYL